jgi:hypothetical protein
MGESPAIALPADVHARVSAMQLEWGIRNPAYLRSLSLEEVVQMNHEFMFGLMFLKFRR